MKCDACKGDCNSVCDWQQGRCPNRKPLINMRSREVALIVISVSLIVAGFVMFMGSV